MADLTDLDGGVRRSLFAPGARAAEAELEQSVRVVADSTVMVQVLGALGGIVFVLNQERQIVATNTALLSRLGIQSAAGILGLRPGEALQCRNSSDAPSGCGTSRACSECGAVLAILAAQCDGEVSERECLLTVQWPDGERAVELKARAAPFYLEGHGLVLLSLQDIADRKRRETLERVFLHDLMNTVGALRAYSELLLHGDSVTDDILGEMRGITQHIVSEVETQRDLFQAEHGEYVPKLSLISTGAVLDRLARIVLRHEVAAERFLHCSGARVRIRTDVGMLERVLVNMVKNAFEATPRGGSVSVRCAEDLDAVVFGVQNRGVIEQKVISQLFQRSFSTKPGVGRGLGTYSMKLFGERYLRGQIGFTTSSENGTEFTFRMPRDYLPADGGPATDALSRN